MLQIYTDGACSGNPGRGGWAYYIPQDGYGTSGYESDTTSYRMELQAVIEALKARPTAGWVEILSDSKYITDAFTQGWVRKWLKNDFKKGKIKNRDLWEELIPLALGKRVTFTWIKGHEGTSGNEMADRMATDASKGVAI